MRAVIQRTASAAVTVDSKSVGEIGRGLLILLGVGVQDTEKEAELLASKIAALRIFGDEAGRLNRSLADVSGGALVVSNFTLYADCRRGRRPDFKKAAGYEPAEALYEYFCGRLRAEGVEKVETGLFGGDMAVSLVNDGPVTLILDTDDLK